MMLKDKRIQAFERLGAKLKDRNDRRLTEAMIQAEKENAWFTKENAELALTSLGDMLKKDKLEQWLNKYDLQEATMRSIGVIMAGNIPLVGFHDYLCILISGNQALIKLSSDDKTLLPAVHKILSDIEPGFKKKVRFVESFNDPAERPDAFIATGSNNSARYFEYYFKDYPHIIRRNRNSIAVLTGNETDAELQALAKDIFSYFGLGCRNVSKLYLPAGFELDRVFKSLVLFGDVIHHHKYANNYQYYRSIYLLNSQKFLDNNFVLVKESDQLSSPIANLFYEYYNSETELQDKLSAVRDQIQCISGNYSPLADVKLGQAQQPQLWDYADGVDVLSFIASIK